MNYSLLTTGRTTHLKIVAVAIVATITFVVVGISARTSDIATARIEADGMVVKAGKPATYAGQEAFTVR
jgi:hypothetical protein